MTWKGPFEMRGGQREDLLASLKRVQDEHAHLPRECIIEISRSLDIPLSDVFGVATFYSFLSPRPQGRHIIRVCGSVPCYLKDSQMIIRGVAAELGIGPGETTSDGRFSLELTNCIGACDTAPAMLVNDDVHGDLNPTKIAQVLRSYT
jgi:NADH-quinone oxidoreductase subunit E